MTTLAHQPGQQVERDTDSWLAAFLNRYVDEGISDQIRRDCHARLRVATLVQIISAIETANHQPGARVVIELYQQWILSQPPGSQHLYLAWFNLGVELCQTRDQSNAIVAYQSALALRPDFHSAAVNLGNLLEARGMPDAALQTWERSIQPDDARLTLLNNRARVLEQLGRFEEAEQEMRRSLLTKPNQPDVIQHWVHVRQKMCQWPVLTTEIAGLSIDDLLRHAGPLSTLALTDDIDLQRQAGRDWIARKTFPVPVALSPPGGYHHDRIRLGYLSSDFCRHAMCYLIAELFERHDRTRFEVFGYCSSPEDGSDIRARVIRSFDQFRSIKPIPDDEAARVIRNDEIDILIDLNGLTSGARPQILRSRPAPVLATYLGFVGPVPLPELDHMLCDDIVVPESLASAYEPKPLHIAVNYQANDSKRKIGAATTRPEAGLPADKFVFCCFSNHYKTTEQMFSAWMEILRNSDDSVLWLVGDNEWAQRNMLARAAVFGVDPARIIFASRVGPDEYMARLPLADLFLDTFPYNAGTIASDAIRMGLPLLTMSGRSFASRMAASLLTAAGASQGIVTSLRAYIDFAVRMATDKLAFDAYKGIFSADAWCKDIGNIETFTRSYEQALSAINKRPTICPS
jgi:predicted O-linked N-acetylglucosamine transferase (SPINDLY family)